LRFKAGAWVGEASAKSTNLNNALLCQRKTNGGQKKGLANLWSRKKIRKKGHAVVGKISNGKSQIRPIAKQVRKTDDYTRPKGSLTPVLVVVTLLYMLGLGTWLVTSDRILTNAANQVLGVLLSTCAAYQIWFWPGVFSLTYKKSPFVIKLGGAAVIYFGTLWFWESPLSPVVPTSSVRQETSSFADTLQKTLAEFRAGLLKELPKGRSTADFEDTMNKAIGQAKAEIDRFCSSHKLTEAEKRTLNNLLKRFPAETQILANDSSIQAFEQTMQEVTNNHINSTILSRIASNSLNNFVNTNHATNRTNAVAEVSGGPISVNTGIETNTLVTIPVSSLPVETPYQVVDSAPSAQVMPSVVSNALVMNWDALASKYPYGFNIQYLMQNYGPYNASSDQPYTFSLVRGRPELTMLPKASGFVFLPTLSYMDYKFSKPVHMTQLTGQYRTDNGSRLRRPWHIVPVATYIESLGAQIFVIGNGPDGDWQSGLFNSIQPYLYQLEQYFPHGFYMLTADGRELNIFKSVDPNTSALWSSTSVTKQQLGWLVTFPPEAVNGRELQTLPVPYPNQLETLKIEGDHATNTVGVIVYQLQSGPLFFMGIRNN
jgi:hypothetical protein